jgi:hypothetical protein
MSRLDPSEFIPTSDSTSEQWIEFYKALRKWFSKTESNNQWLRFWNQRAGAGSEADDHTLRSYMDDQGVDLTTDTKGEISDTLWGISDWIGDTVKWLRAITIGIVLIIIALLTMYVYSHFIKQTPADQIPISSSTPFSARRKGLDGGSSGDLGVLKYLA